MSLASQGEKVVSDDLLVLRWRLEFLSRRDVRDVIPLEKQLGHIVVSLSLELRSFRSIHQLELQQTQ